MTDYAWGVLTPFLAVGALAVLAGVAYLLLAVGRHLWAKTHLSIIDTIPLRRNRVDPFDDDNRPEYLDAANTFRDALLASPRLHTLTGLGWMVILVRDGKTDPS